MLICYLRIICYNIWRYIRFIIILSLKIIFPILFLLLILIGISLLFKGYDDSNLIHFLKLLSGLVLMIISCLLFWWYKNEFFDIELFKYFNESDLHKYGEPVYIAPEKCEQIVRCQRCGKIKSRTVYVCHIWHESGYIKNDCCGITKTCQRCGKTENGENHNWSEWISSEPCIRTRTCQRCGKTEEIESHNWSKYIETSPTIYSRTCSVCERGDGYEDTDAQAWCSNDYH